MSNAKIQLVFCTYPGIFSDTVFKALQQSQRIQIIGIVHSTRIFSAQEKWLSSALRLINTSGLSYAVLQFIQTDIYLWLHKFCLLAANEKKLPVYRTKNINTPEGLAFLKSLQPDVILLANFNQKISAEIINLPRLACLNIHPSLLPNYKGVDPVFAALYAQETRLGVTVHLVAEEFDSGDILAQTEIDVDKNRSVFSHHWRLFQLGGKLAAAIIEQLPESLRLRVKNTGGNYDSWATKTKVKNLAKRGRALIQLQDLTTILFFKEVK